MNDFTFTMSDNDAKRVHQLIDGHCKALKNWIASAVESDELHRAGQLVQELRQHERLFAAFNVDARYSIAEATGKPVERNITVRAS